MTNQLKTILIAITIVSLGLIGYGVVTLTRQSGKIETEIFINPSGAQIKIDGKKTNGTKVYLTEGSHTFEASSDGYKSITRQQVIYKNANKVFIALEPNSEATLQKISENPTTQKERESIGGAEADREGRLLYEKNPVLYMLPQPFNQSGYAIDYEISDRSKTGAVIQITATTEKARQHALDDLRNLGYDVSDMYIEFDDFKNPLTDKKE